MKISLPTIPSPAASATDIPEDRELLAEDPLGNVPLPPEIVTPLLAHLETWDESAQEAGFRVPPQPPDDEAEFPEILAEEGLDEAEEELRSVQEAEETRMEREEEEIEEARDDADGR